MYLKDFDRIECVCVDNRKNEWKALEKQFKQREAKINRFIVGKGEELPKEYYDQIDDKEIPIDNIWGNQFTKNAYFCHLAHRKILEKAKKDDVKNILLLEDDCQLTENFDEILEKVNKQIKDLKIEWDTLTFGQNLKWGKATQVSKNILKLNNGVYCWHAIAIKNTMFNHLLNLPISGPFDYLWANYIQPNFNCYGVWPNIAIQKPGMSYVNGRIEDYSEFLKEKGNNIIV